MEKCSSRVAGSLFSMKRLLFCYYFLKNRPIQRKTSVILKWEVKTFQLEEIKKKHPSENSFSCQNDLLYSNE